MIDWLGQLTEEEKVKAIHRAFSQVASTQDGAIVFATIFEQLYLFRPCKDPEGKVLNEYGKFLLRYFGADVEAEIIKAILVSARAPNIATKEKTNGD